MEGMSVDAGDQGGSVDGRSENTTKADKADFLIISLKDLASVKAVTEAQGLESTIVPLSKQQPDVVAYVYGTDSKCIQAIADTISKQQSIAGGKSWINVSAAIAMASITTWATLACL